MRTVLYIMMIGLFFLVACSEQQESNKSTSNHVSTEEEIEVSTSEAASKEESGAFEEENKEEDEETPVISEEVAGDAEEKVSEESSEEETEAEEETTQQITTDEIKEIIEYYSLGEDDSLGNYSLENGEIKATVELAPSELFPAEDMAVNAYSQLSDELLYYDGWDLLTVTYAGVGTISMNRNEKETNEYGDYFPTLVIEDRLSY
ncbi:MULTISPECIES: hypothetical protein [Bacillaceae]|uniref:hypothetical protein n=1 Tax=Bacillaceae TaxID=186817 RepID=UPI001E5B535B|nr:hypothetical protein [Bacillus sp. Au-Bac7]MCE4048938.1 hypothetical protein [Bacillus sp. Au-Bac7]